MILVTGGMGYIGSHTVVELIKAGYECTIVDDLRNSYNVLDKIEKITGVRPRFIHWDVCDKYKIFELIKEDVQGVIHFAAYKSVPESLSKPLDYYENNITPVINILKAFQMSGMNNLIFSSSCAVYGDKNKFVDESSEINPMSVYAETKAISERIIEKTCNTSKLKAISLRYFNPVGAHGEIGENSKGAPDNLFPVIIETLKGKREKMFVYGNDYPTADRTCHRDFVHVQDVAKAHVIALERLIDNQNKTNYEVFNIGTGFPYSVLSVIKGFESLTGLKVNYEIVGRREGDVASIYANTDKAEKVLGWKAEKSLHEMIKSAWEYANV